MSIEAWNIVLSAAILGALIVGGIWLKYVVEQQLKSKDTAIQALKGVVELKDAHISTLQGDTAPAIAKAYADMRKHADQITEDFNKVSAKLSETTDRQPSNTALCEARGLMLASDILDRYVTEFFADGGTLRSLDTFEEPMKIVSNAFFAAYAQITSQTRTRISTAQKVLGHPDAA